MMKYISLFLLLGITIAFCIWYKATAIIPDKTDDRNTGIKWNDSLYKHLPGALDTTVVVKDGNGTTLKFHQYIKPVFNHEAVIFQDRGVWRLQRKTQTAIDSLKQDDGVVARMDRWLINQPDTIKRWQTKLNNIAFTLAQADYILVLKSKRLLFIQRKGVNILMLPLNLGRAPVGKKEFNGDGKTPEGVYYLDDKYVRNDKYYKSFWISYPNEQDKLYAKLKKHNPGAGICIHGTKPDKTNAKDWTAGCIALANSDMDTLFKYVASGTVIEIRK